MQKMGVDQTEMLALAALLFWLGGSQSTMDSLDGEYISEDVRKISLKKREGLLTDLHAFMQSTRSQKEADLRLSQILLLLPSVHVRETSCEPTLQRLAQDLRSMVLMSDATGIYRTSPALCRVMNIREM